MSANVQKNSNIMIIPKKTLREWKTLSQHGDRAAIADKNKIRRGDISAAFNNGECREDIFIMIRDFYNERKKVLTA